MPCGLASNALKNLSSEARSASSASFSVVISRCTPTIATISPRGSRSTDVATDTGKGPSVLRLCIDSPRQPFASSAGSPISQLDLVRRQDHADRLAEDLALRVLERPRNASLT